MKDRILRSLEFSYYSNFIRVRDELKLSAIKISSIDPIKEYPSFFKQLFKTVARPNPISHFISIIYIISNPL